MYRWDIVVGETEFFDRLSRLISSHFGKTIGIGPDTDLLASGVVDSKTMVDVLLFVEELSGRAVDIDLLDAAIFEKPRLMYEVFFRQ
jgi:hypothetical protein